MKRLNEKQESERWFTKARSDFDRWFFSFSKAEQMAMRAKGILPYSEMKSDEYIFPVNTESAKAVCTPIYDPSDPTDSDTFYSRERVEEFTRRILDTLEYSHSPEVRLHFQLLRIVLRDHRAMDGESLAKLFGMTRAGINFRVQKIRETLFGCEKRGIAPAKESPRGGGKPRRT